MGQPPTPEDSVMDTRTRLARRYRRLLLAYPGGWRRRHGSEMVTTLLDAAPADRGRPTRAEVVDLLVSGVRHRFRVRGAAAVVAAVCAAVFAAVATGALGGFAGWQTAPDLPRDADAARILRPALPPGAAPDLTRWDFVFDDNPDYTDPRWTYWLAGTDVYEYGRVFVDLPPAAAVRPVTAPPGLRVEATTTYRLGAPDPVLRIAIVRATPAAVLPLTVLGLLAGAVAGWLAVAWARRRGAGHRPLRQAFAALLFGGGLLALLPATVMSAAALVIGVSHPADPVPGWAGYTFVFARAAAWLGALSLAAALVTVASGRDVAGPDRTPAGAR
jgi:hypothetical protein